MLQLYKMHLKIHTITKRTEQIWRSGAKSFLKESCIESINFAFIMGFPLIERDRRNLGITAIERLF
ncbi:hypothetical protein CHI14_13110 [Paenibacillus sp. 7516]|nr:hypothetical protein CHI14_13110 [Paenibacillus sp. 7516]